MDNSGKTKGQRRHTSFQEGNVRIRFIHKQGEHSSPNAEREVDAASGKAVRNRLKNY